MSISVLIVALLGYMLRCQCVLVRTGTWGVSRMCVCVWVGRVGGGGGGALFRSYPSAGKGVACFPEKMKICMYRENSHKTNRKKKGTLSAVLRLLHPSSSSLSIILFLNQLSILSALPPFVHTVEMVIHILLLLSPSSFVSYSKCDDLHQV